MAEAVLCAVPIKTVKLLGIPKSFALVLTNQRTILISLTSDMLKQAAIDARDDAAAEGKGFMGKWAAQMKATLGYTSRFLDMDPEEILSQYPKHEVIPNDNISKVRIKTRQDSDGDITKWLLMLYTPVGKSKYELQSRTKDVLNAFKQVYGNRFKG
jgi:hypothetical protein